MSAPFKSASLSSSALRASLLGLGLAIGLAFVVGPAKAVDSIDCLYSSKADAAQMIAACSAIIDNDAASRTDRAAAMVTRAEVRSRDSDKLSAALADLDRAIALDDKNAERCPRTWGEGLLVAGVRRSVTIKVVGHHTRHWKVHGTRGSQKWLTA